MDRIEVVGGHERRLRPSEAVRPAANENNLFKPRAKGFNESPQRL
jgi:hypothetical protein